jgi:outer membrane protein, multidrug efflux system
MRRNLLKFALVLTSGMLLSFAAGCSVGPKYKKPAIVVPAVYRGTEQAEIPPADLTAFADKKWPEVFPDAELQKLIQTALDQNHDVRIAAARVLQKKALVGAARADQLPTVSGGTNLNATRNARSQFFPPFSTSQAQLGLTASWELDFWGKYRNATEAARADLLTSEWARRAVVNSLIADIADSYFQLRALDLELQISQRTLASRKESLNLNKDLADRGLISQVDVRQAEQLVYSAAARIPDIQRQIEQEENLISTLIGHNPEAIPRGRALTEQSHAPDIPPGLPSSLLERRPDIQQAEQQLIAFNARTGVAKAANFPQISLTGSGGFQSNALSRLFTGPGALWNIAGGLTQPIFAGGKIKAGVQFAEAQEQEALEVYQRTIQQGFREVSDALVGYRKNREFREQQELLTQSAEESSRLADIRYRGGLTSYLEVLTNQTNYFTAELGLAQARLSELQSYVQLYRALGGGWEP